MGRGIQAVYIILPDAISRSEPRLHVREVLSPRLALARLDRQPSTRGLAPTGQGTTPLRRPPRVRDGRHCRVPQVCLPSRATRLRADLAGRAARFRDTDGHIHRRAKIRQEPVPTRDLYKAVMLSDAEE